jgi:TRAP-type C4-dicarboxylate transport system substrate-binding protein
MPKHNLRLGGYQPETSVHTRALHHMVGLLTERLGASVEASITADVTTHGHRAGDLLNMVEEGRLEGCYFASSYLAARVPALTVFDLPFVATDRNRDYAKLDGEFGARLASDVAARTQFRVLGYWDNGFRHISNRLKPLRHPDDCRGLRLRTLDNTFHQEIFAALGCVPVFLDVRDLADAVVRQTIDAQENPLTNLLNFGLHHTHRHVSLTSHFFGVALFLVNGAWFDALPPEIQSTLRAIVEETTKRQRALAIAEDKRCLDALRSDGVAIVPAEEIDFGAFRAAVQPVVERQIAKLGGG